MAENAVCWPPNFIFIIEVPHILSKIEGQDPSNPQTIGLTKSDNHSTGETCLTTSHVIRIQVYNI